ncbi:MAG TPA: DHA2 family efflux MFS transporter permease subunit [Spirochaetia bacterium]|nr:DHA2 family efflux MFS transporter permease subunit [Spirochaetia bacterium]
MSRERGIFTADNVSPTAGGIGVKDRQDSIPWAALMILMLGAFMAVLDSSIVNVAIPKLMALFGVGPDQAEWVMTGYLLTSGVVVPVTGYLGNRFGYKRLYIVALSIFTLGSALCSLSWNNDILIGARIIQAIGGGAIMPVTMAMNYSIVPRNRIGMALGIWSIAITMGPAIGPTLGGYLIDNFNWQMIFTINIPIGIIAVILAGLFLPETPGRSGLKFDMPGFILSGVGCFAILLALSEGQTYGWTSLFIVATMVVGLFAMVLFVLWELYTPHPLLDVRLFRNFVFSISLVTVSVIFIGLFAIVFLVPIYAQDLLGYTPMQTGLLLMPQGLAMGVMMPINGRIFDRFGALPMAAIGAVVLTFVTFSLHKLDLSSSYSHIQLLLIMRGIGVSLCMMPVTASGMNSVPRRLASEASAWTNLIRNIAASMGIAFLTYVMQLREVYHAEWLSETVTLSSPLVPGLLQRMQVAMHLPNKTAVLTVWSLFVQQHAMMAAIDDSFLVATVIVVIAIPLVLLLGKKRVEAARLAETRRLEGTSS